MNILGIIPKIVFVNEQTFSKSLVDLYYEVGYEALIMEWNNAYSLNKKIKKDFVYSPIIVKGISYFKNIFSKPDISFFIKKIGKKLIKIFKCIFICQFSLSIT